MKDSTGVSVVATAAAPSTAVEAVGSSGSGGGEANSPSVSESEIRDHTAKACGGLIIGNCSGDGNSSPAENSNSSSNSSSTPASSEAESPAPSSAEVDGDVTLSDSQEEQDQVERLASSSCLFASGRDGEHGSGSGVPKRDEPGDGVDDDDGEIQDKFVTAFTSAFEKQNVHFEKGERREKGCN